MQPGLSITDLAKKIEANKELKQDYIATTNITTVEVHDDKKLALVLPSSGEFQGGSFPLLDHTHRQLGSFTKIPADYYERMRAEEPNLLASNIETWFRRFPADSKRMLRTLGGDARGWLSNKYQRIENEAIANAALPVLADIPGVQIVSSEVTDLRMHIHFVVPSVTGEITVAKGRAKVGDIMQAGGVIGNSEVGAGSASVSGLLWRLICLNGMKTADTFARRHVGRRVDDNEALWADDTRRADDTTVLLKLRDMVRAVVDEARFRQNLAKLQDLTEGKIEGDPAKAVEVLAKKVGATEAESGGILRALIEGADLSRWGIVNAITAQAHTARSYDRAVAFEEMGGALVELPKDQWKEILQAA